MNQTKTKAHIITHTHWDREWFLTSIYTRQWIAGLIDKLSDLVEANPEFQFLFDGQTLVIEDLLAVAPEYREKIEALIQGKHLIIGPYYCQPDWQLSHPESLIRNLMYGQRDIEQFGGENNRTGWLVDTFGHIGQAPQLHRLFGVEKVFVWRGVPRLEPFFKWTGSNGQALLTVNLFGGYRNLYGITHAPELGVKRLTEEVKRLRPFYPAGDIPLFDGYDLEDNPEDPVSFYRAQQASIPPALEVVASTPQAFAAVVAAAGDTLPQISGELNSGKYGATFPGTFSTRAYLKVMARDCAHLLYQVGEPLAAMAYLKGRPYHGHDYERRARELLQNGVHDCICGVSIDQVHEKMEHIYRDVFEGLVKDIKQSAAWILGDFAPATYAISTNPFPYEGTVVFGDRCYQVKTEGVGVWQVADTRPVEMVNVAVEAFSWSNDHYSATLNADGSVQIGEALLGRFVVSAENGDTYSDERGEMFGALQVTASPVIEQRSDLHSVVRYSCAIEWDGGAVSADVRLWFDRSPLVHWEVDLDSDGVNFRVEMVFETGHAGAIHAGMPFDAVPRLAVDRDLLPGVLEPALAQVLRGQRELGEVRTFPFHDFVTYEGEDSIAVIFARGLHSYEADTHGHIAVMLRRSVEWLTAPDLEHRVGDAGPFFYVPDARCERRVRHELAVAIGASSGDQQVVQRLNAGFQNPPLVVRAHTEGSETEWAFLQENLPLSSLQVQDGQVSARFYNPTGQPLSLQQNYTRTDVWGQPTGDIREVSPGDIVTLHINETQHAAHSTNSGSAIEFLSVPRWRVGPNKGLPRHEIIEQLKAWVTRLEEKLARLAGEIERATGRERYIAQHRYYVYDRERLEYLLSVKLNELKLADQGQMSEEYLFKVNPEVAEIGWRLNQLRIKRRIYDYVVDYV